MANTSRTFTGTIRETTPGADASREVTLSIKAEEVERVPSTKPPSSLVWINATTDVTPRFDAWVHDAADGDVLTIQIADTEGFSSPIEYAKQLSSAEYAAHNAAVGFAPLSNGTWHARMKANDGPWSATGTHVIDADTSAPVLSAPIGVGLTYSTAMVGATTDEASGTLYYAITTSPTPPPPPGTADIIGSQLVSTTGVQEIEVSGISDPGGTIYAHLVQEDVAGKGSNIATSAGFTIPAASGAAFHPTFVIGNATLSNSDRTIVTIENATVARSLVPYKGKKLVAYTYDVDASGDSGLILPATNSAGVGGAPGWTDTVPNACLAWSVSGWVASNGVLVLTGPPFAVGDTLGVAVDDDALLLWLTKDGTTFCGANGMSYCRAQVEAGTGGISYASTDSNGPVYSGAGSGGATGWMTQITMLTDWPWPALCGYSYLE